MRRLSGWTRLWIVCAVLMWGWGGWKWINNPPYIGERPEFGPTSCYGDPPLSITEMVAEPPGRSGADIIREIDLEEAAKQREPVLPGSSMISREIRERIATARPCTPDEQKNMIADYHGRVVGFLGSVFLVLVSPLVVAGLFIGLRAVVRWVWQGFKPSTS